MRTIKPADVKALGLSGGMEVEGDRVLRRDADAITVICSVAQYLTGLTVNNTELAASLYHLYLVETSEAPLCMELTW